MILTLRSCKNGQVDLDGFQVFDRGCLKSLKEELRGERKLGFVNARSANEFEMFSKIKAKYPTWTKIMSSIAATVKVNTALAEFLVAIIEHTEEIFDSAPVRQETDYTERNLGEIDAQLFPNFPVIRERAYYEKKCNVEDEKSLSFMCEKVFPSHNKLTPGLMIMTCACPQKVVYGFSLMTSGESPQFLFDIVMSRFPADYSPSIVYDNACKFKEYGLNRETQRFMELQITVDKFHQCNHTSCGESFKSSEYASLSGKNTQSCEQTNAKLRQIATSCTFMNPDMFMTAVTMYLGYQNLAKKM